MLKRGDKGSQVANLQKMLNKVINAGLKIDGIFGNATFNAVIKYQRQKQIKPDGVVGDVTYSLLQRDYLEKTNEAPIIRNGKITFVKPLQELKPQAVKYLVLHHSAIAKDLKVEEIDRMHKSKGWAGIGYHFFITKSGEIFSGRPLNRMGAHVDGHNHESIGICFSGNFMEEELTHEQRQAGVALVKWLKYKVYGNKVKVVGHKEIDSTACPGRNFPLDAFKSL